MLSNAGAYVHFPWCVRKCPYCDFNSHPLKSNTDFDQYATALISDWRAQATQLTQSEHQPLFQTVFFGGGTPSLFAAPLMQTVLRALPLQANAEVTMEANPGTTEHMDFADYRAAGINRLSIGAQSFNDTQLKKLGRIHIAAETLKAYAQARAAGFENINLDIMWGLPQQTLAEALADLRAAIDLTPEHISWYQLTIEAKTEFAKRPVLLPVEQTIADIERHGLALLAEAGYQRYEVSAFAKPGSRCQHNLNYWGFGDYAGIGAGAHGKISHRHEGALNILRTRKASQPRLYLAQPEQTISEPIAADALVVEFMMNALRLVEGVSWHTFAAHTGLQQAAISDVWNRLADQGLVQEAHCAATARGMRYLDTVLGEFLTTSN